MEIFSCQGGGRTLVLIRLVGEKPTWEMSREIIGGARINARALASLITGASSSHS